MNLPTIPGKLNFIIDVHSSYSDKLTGGIVVMHKLANAIAKKGHNVFIFCEPEYPHKNIFEIECSLVRTDKFIETYLWEPFTYNLNNTIAVYPQVTGGNPYNVRNVARWLLYNTEEEIEESYADSDKFFNFSNFKTFKLRDSKQLMILDFNLDKLYITNFGKRKGFCSIVHKNFPPAGDEVLSMMNSFDLTNWKDLGGYDYLRETFNKYEYFLTYDQKSFYSVAAGLCGCKTIILNPGKPYEFAEDASSLDDYRETVTPMEFRIENPIQLYGIAYGWDDVQWANRTIGMVRDHLIEFEKYCETTVDNFVKYWENKLRP